MTEELLKEIKELRTDFTDLKERLAARLAKGDVKIEQNEKDINNLGAKVASIQNWLRFGFAFLSILIVLLKLWEVKSG